MGFGQKLQHAWNVLSNNESDDSYSSLGLANASYSTGRPDRLRLAGGNERSIVGAIYNRLAVDFAGVSIRHVRLDDQERYLDDMPSQLNTCLMLDPNIDQTARAFRQDVALTLFDKGAVAIVPVDITQDPGVTAGYDVVSMRVGTITKWLPRHVRVRLWDDTAGKHREVTVPKKYAAIFENPFYSVMNETNSTTQRLIRKLNILDAIDEQSGSGKLDLIIQLPYAVKNNLRKTQAAERRSDIEFQLRGSKYGIAYIDGTEKITQLNRPVDNNLLKQIEFLTTQLFDQLGLTPEIMNGTANEQVMLNYTSRTIEPILDVFVEAMTRTFLTKTARSQGQVIRYYRDPFKLVPVATMAELGDKFARNEILSPNEIRSAMGMVPSKDPKSDQLQNRNMPAPSEPALNVPTQEGDYQNGS